MVEKTIPDAILMIPREEKTITSNLKMPDSLKMCDYSYIENEEPERFIRKLMDELHEQGFWKDAIKNMHRVAIVYNQNEIINEIHEAIPDYDNLNKIFNMLGIKEWYTSYTHDACSKCNHVFEKQETNHYYNQESESYICSKCVMENLDEYINHITNSRTCPNILLTEKQLKKYGFVNINQTVSLEAPRNEKERRIPDWIYDEVKYKYGNKDTILNQVNYGKYESFDVWVKL